MSTEDDRLFLRLIAENQVARELLMAAAEALGMNALRMPAELIPGYLAAIEAALTESSEHLSRLQTDRDSPDGRHFATLTRDAFEELSAEFLERLKSSLPKYS